MRSSDTGDLWWKNAVFYCADVETFYDWNGDGTGDIRGMTERIEYLYDLGVTCLWLMPFYPTARKDDGYDITDFFGVDPRLGTHGDFVELVRTARSSGIRVIIDFVMNHTSDASPVVQVRPPQQGRPVPRLLRVERDRAQVEPEGRRLPRPGGQHLGTRPQDQRVVPAPLLQAPTRPQHRESQSAGRDLTHARLLARARGLGLPGRRRPVPLRQGRRAGNRRRVRPQPVPRRRPQLRHPPGRGRRPARRGQSSVQGPEDVLRRARRRRAQHAVRLHRDAEHLPLARPRRRPSDRQGPAAATEARRDEPVGQLRAQPRRAHPRQAERRSSARRSSTPSAPTRTCSSTAADSAEGFRPCSAATSGGCGWPTR